MKHTWKIGIALVLGVLLTGCGQKPVEQRPAADCKLLDDYETYETVTVDSLADVPQDCKSLLLTTNDIEIWSDYTYEGEEQQYYQYSSETSSAVPRLDCFAYIVKVPEEERVSVLEEVSKRDLTQLGLIHMGIENLDALSQMASLEVLWISSETFSTTFTGSFPALKDLQCRYCTMGKFGDLEKLTGLQKLTLYCTDLKSVKGIQNLTALSKLNLEGSTIYSLKPLRGMTQLTSLNLSMQSRFGHTSHPDLGVLEGMTHLQSLGLNANCYGFKHMETLSTLTELENLSMVDCKLEDTQVLAPLTKLHVLDLRANKIGDISPLSGMGELEELQLHNNRLSEIAVVSEMPHLRVLTIGWNDIIDISPVRSLNELERFSVLGCANLTDITPLQGKSSLKSLRLSATNVKDTETLATLRGLETLDISGTKTAEMDFLVNLTGLRDLNVSGEKITDFTHITHLSKLEKLDISNTHIRNIEGIEKLGNLKSLSMSSTNVESVEPLLGMASLYYVDLSNCRKLMPEEMEQLKEKVEARGGTVEIIEMNVEKSTINNASEYQN